MKVTPYLTFADMMPEGLSVKMAQMMLELSDGNQLLASDVFEEVEYKGVESGCLVVCPRVARCYASRQDRLGRAVWHVLRSARCWLDDRR